jgi:hypothetical protein
MLFGPHLIKLLNNKIIVDSAIIIQAEIAKDILKLKLFDLIII